MADRYYQSDEPFDIFGSDPFGRNYIYGLSGNGDGLGLQPPVQGLPVDTRPYDRMQATPRSFISGLFSDVLGGALNMPDLPKTGVPALDLLYANRKPLMNFMGVGDVQKTAERISYGEPLTTGAGMTLRPRDETIGAALTVAPFVGEATAFGARAGRAGARMVGERMAENVAMGRPNLPSMFAEPRSSLFAVEPSPMMPKPQAPVSELGFYSATEQAALNLPRNKGTGQSFLNDLMKSPDVKKDELAWTGLDDFLKDKPNVTKQEVQDFIANNKVDLQEVRLGEQPPYDKIRLATLENELSQLKEHPIDAPTFGEEKFNELLKLQNIRDQSTVDSLYSGAEVAIRNAQRAQAAGNKELANKYFLESEMFNTRAEALDLQGLGVPNPTRYSKYQLAGGENYREILLKMPKESPTTNDIATRLFNKEMRFLSEAEKDAVVAEARRIEDTTPKDYISSHFSEPNILAHIRVNDRVDADGKKMLLVEEIQSDWHQAGREKGYAPKYEESFMAYYETKDGQKIPIGYGNTKKEADASIDVGWKNQVDIKYETHKRIISEGVPDAPFKDTWYQLALKRVMKYAADNGYERVGLTTGKQQAKRYDLGNEVNSIDVESVEGVPNLQLVDIDVIGGQKIALEVENGVVREGEFAGKRLSDVVGKEMADKITNVSQGKTKSLAGEDLRLGGEGMKKYYDEIYPKFLEKYGKKWDASVGETEIKTGQRIQLFGVGKIKTGNEKVRYIDITPKMKESVGKGQPLFTAIPAGTLGLGGLEYADPFASPLTEDTTR